MNKQIKKLNLTLILTLIGLFTYSSLSAQNHNFAQAGSIVGAKYGTGEDSVKCVTNFSLYRENYRQWRASNFENEAINYTIEPWRYVFLNCPLASQNTYIDGSKIIEYLYNNVEAEELKLAYIDTLRLLYDNRIRAFGLDPNLGEGYILGRKGIEILNYAPNNFEEAYSIFERSVALSGNQSESATLYYYFLTTARMIREANADSTIIFDVYDIVTSAIDANLKSLQIELENNPAESQKINRNITSFQNVMVNIENIFEPFASCENLVKIFGPKFKENLQDAEMLKKIISSLERKNCTDPLYYEVSEALYSAEPTPESAFAIGRMYFKLDEYGKTLRYLQEAVQGLEDANQKADAYMLMANVYRTQKNYSNARANALKVIELRPNDGSPWIMIGDLYAMSASSCGDNPISSRAAFWAAVDKYVRARSVDSSEANVTTVNSRIATYSAHFPAREDIFFYGYTIGDSYRIECWINETTTVRAKD